jgi:Predicted dithiol-disulfide isomerase involved in polyketide biosynthesis
MEKMKIEIWSDIACPYCYIGKRKLEGALNNFPHRENVEIIWHSYELNPDLPATPLNKSIYQFIASQYNVTVEQQKKNMEQISSSAHSLDLNFDFDRTVVANTSKALRLVKLAAKYNLANEAEEALFDAYFVSGKDVSDDKILLNIGEGIGIPQSEISKMLDSDQFMDEVKKDIKYSEEELNLQYIPFYRINDKFIIQGSVTTDEYLETLHKAYESWSGNDTSSSEGDSISGKACSIDGICEI